MISTGMKGLDKVINGLQWGDNVVWQIDSIDHYIEFVKPFVQSALLEKRHVVYIHFGEHKALLPRHDGITVYTLDTYAGFESFSTQIHGIIRKEGEGVIYVFDCLSELLAAWSNDLMIGNFFKITCPYLFEVNTIAYFALLRNKHSFKTVARIRDTTQLLIDVYHHKGQCYVHPLKVWNRYSPTMFLPHVRNKKQFMPIASSVDTARLFANIFKSGIENTSRSLDFWDKLFMRAEEVATQKGKDRKAAEEMVAQLCRIIIGRDEKMLRLAEKHFTLNDLLDIKSRMIGTGFIGGKAVGMLIARNILLKNKPLRAANILEPHDSFYVGSDVFYSYFVENGWWKARMEQRTKEGYYDAARTLREKMLTGTFPEEVKEQFRQMIEYYGQSPIIVRSSSLLEDGYGNAFAGKYESVFLVNQGPPEKRFAGFLDAVRKVYASTMNEDALVYRQQRGLDQLDEQMALLVQRVSGSYRKNYFFPDIAGVGISFNTFVWKKSLDPKAGFLRLVFGLGTRAVNRVEGDYPRILALDEPLLKVNATRKDAQKYSQHDVDVLDIKDNHPRTISFRELLKQKIPMNLELVATRDDDGSRTLREMGIDEESWIVDFDSLVSRTPFTQNLSAILRVLEADYKYPVDIEFTVNFTKEKSFQINLLQCRPLQTKGLGPRVALPGRIPMDKIVFQSEGNFLGGNISQKIDKIIYVEPSAYYNLASQSDKYNIARAVGLLNRKMGDRNKSAVMLLGPGRWGTSTPSLGVPVSFAEINNITILGEIAYSSGGLSPEISFGTHFFQDLVETEIFYLALCPEDHSVIMNDGFFKSIPPMPDAVGSPYHQYKDVIRVYDAKDARLRVMSDIMSQRIICFFD